MYLKFFVFLFIGALWSSESFASRMKCLVDTPAKDHWGYERCFSVGVARTATAVFLIEGAPANFKIIWSDSNCKQNSATCRIPIFQYQTLTVSAYVLDMENMTFDMVHATAMYEGFD